MASVPVSGEMPDELVCFLSGGRLVVVATVDSDGWPYTMVMNWAVAKDSKTLRLCIGHKTQSLRNIRASGRAMVEVIGDGMVYGVRGPARVIVEQMQHAPIPSAMVEVAVDLVKRDLPDGVEVDPPAYRWGALESYMSKLDPLGFEEMRTHST